MMVKSSKPGKFIIYKPWYDHREVAKVHDGYFVFGDNVAGYGSGPKSGQAVIRGLPNAIGISTKWKPTNEPDAFFTDDDRRCFEYIYQGFGNVIRTLKAGWNVYYPEGGIGSGRADLKLNAPELYSSIQYMVNLLKEKYPE